jgi:tetratricopeptide (TPR) repeat protein
MSDSHLQAGEAAYKLGNIENAASICRAGIAEAQSAKDEVQVLRLRTLLSQCHWVKGEYEAALLLTEPSSSDSPGMLDPHTKAQLLNQRGFAFTQLGRFAEAREMLEEALRLAATSGFFQVISHIEINRATLFFYLCDYESVETCGRSALAIAVEFRFAEVEASASAAIGKSLMYRQRWAEAVPWYERSVEVFARNGFDYYAMSMRADLGACHFALYEDEKADRLFTQALQNSRDVGALARYHIDLANMGCLHLRRGEHRAALDHFQEAVDIARKLGDSISTVKWLCNLTLTHSCMGNPDLAAVCENEAMRIQRRVVQARAAAAAPSSISAACAARDR